MKTTRFLIVTLLTFSTFFLPNVFAQDFSHTLLTGNRGSVTSVAYSPDGATLAGGSDDATVQLWDAVSGAPKATLTGHTDAVTSVAYSPDGATLATGSRDSTVWLRDAVSGAPKATLTGHTGAVNSVAYSPDGTTLATGSDDGKVWLRDAVSGSHKATLTHSGNVYSVAYSPDGTTLATRSGGNTVRLWDAVSGTPKATLTGHTGSVYSVAYSPDGTTLATGSSDTTVWLWDAVSGTSKATLTGHTGAVNSVAYSPDGTTLATVSRDGTVRLWDAVSGTHKATLTGHATAVNSVAYSPDGTTLATVSRDGTVRLWELPDTRVRITPSPVESPAIGGQLIVNVNIVNGESVGGYQVTVGFNTTALRYLESDNGDYLPAGAFFVPPVVDENRVTLGAASLVGVSNGEGTLAALTFEVLDIKASILNLYDVILTDGDGERLLNFALDGLVVESPLREDVNQDGVVNIQDLVWVASRFGQSVEGKIDVNADGVVNVVDLVKVAGAIGKAAAAPAAYRALEGAPTRAEVQQWLTQARHLNLTDAVSQQGILFLENLLAALTPKGTTLLPNYPNPFNPETWIPYQLATPASVTLTIYAANGAGGAHLGGGASICRHLSESEPCRLLGWQKCAGGTRCERCLISIRCLRVISQQRGRW